MRFSRLFNNRKKSAEGEVREQSPINQGIHYVYMIIGMQVALVFGIVAAIMIVGKVLATPAWVFIAALLAGVAGIIYLYRKAKEQVRRFRESLKKVDMSNRNYQVSVMGGFLTMRVEQQNGRRMLEAPPDSVIEAKTIEAPPAS